MNYTNYWLPENYHLRLTALEVGALMGTIASARERDFPTNKRGAKGEPIPTTMQAVLLEKMDLAMREPDPDLGVRLLENDDTRILEIDGIEFGRWRFDENAPDTKKDIIRALQQILRGRKSR